MPSVDLCPFPASMAQGALTGRTTSRLSIPSYCPESPVASQAAPERVALQPVQASAAPAKWYARRSPVQAQVFQSSVLPPGLSRLFPVLGPAWTDMWGQVHTAASGECGGGAGEQE